jgi:hypothetical protein
MQFMFFFHAIDDLSAEQAHRLSDTPFLTNVGNLSNGLD